VGAELFRANIRTEGQTDMMLIVAFHNFDKDTWKKGTRTLYLGLYINTLIKKKNLMRQKVWFVQQTTHSNWHAAVCVW